MPEFLAFLFSLLVGGLLLLVAVLLRRSASALEDGLPTSQFPRVAQQVAGGVFALGGTIGLLMVLCILLVSRIDMHQTWPTQIPSTVGVALALCIAMGACLLQWSASRRGTAATEPERFRSWRTPIGAVTITCVGQALLSVLMMVLFDLLATPLTGEPPPSILVLASTVPLVLVLTGLALLRSADFLVPPIADRTGAERQALVRVQRNLSILYIVLGSFAAFIIGVPLLIVRGLLSISTMAARHQAARLGALWVLARTLRSSRPLADELTSHAECSKGRMSRLLKRAARDLDEGLPLAQVLYHGDIVPKNSWLQAAGGLSSGRLPEALRSAAARETTRFAASSRPYGRQFVLVYAAALFLVMWLVIAFLMYFIVPKFKKIFEDFDLEFPEATMLLIYASDAYVNYWYVLFPFLPGLLIAAVAAEVYAAYYGWADLWERLLGGRWLRLRTPDLLCGLRWAVIAQRPWQPSPCRCRNAHGWKMRPGTSNEAMTRGSRCTSRGG
jgi:hypothetical protein